MLIHSHDRFFNNSTAYSPEIRYPVHQSHHDSCGRHWQRGYCSYALPVTVIPVSALVLEVLDADTQTTEITDTEDIFYVLRVHNTGSHRDRIDFTVNAIEGRFDFELDYLRSNWIRMVLKILS